MKFRTKAILGLSASLCAGLLVAQTYPQWWLDQSVAPAQPPAAPGEPGHDAATYDTWMADNYAVANLGQAKNIAAAAHQTMETAVAGSSGNTIPGMVAAFSTAAEDNFVPLTIGQLKALSAPFYDVMHAESYTVTLADDTVVAEGTYPWASDVTPDNLAIANLGQLKHIFSFDLSNWAPPTATWEEIPDSWKLAAVNDPNKSFYDPEGLINDVSLLLADDDYDGDGISNYQEYINGTDPIDFFNGATPVLSIWWGDHQTLGPESFAPKSLYVTVEDATGTGYDNAPVQYTVTGGHAGLAPTKSIADLEATLIRRTNTAGAAVRFYTPALASGTLDSNIVASLPSGQSITFTITTEADYSAPSPPYEFKEIINANGTYTYTWRCNLGTGDFSVEQEQPLHSGNWVQLFSVPYSSLDTPTDGNRYTVTVDSNFSVITQ